MVDKTYPFCYYYTIHINTEKGVRMKVVAIMLISLALTACGTIGGTVSGMGEDLSKLGNVIRK